MYMYVCMYACMHACMHACMYMYVYVYMLKCLGRIGYISCLCEHIYSFYCLLSVVLGYPVSTVHVYIFRGDLCLIV